MDPQELYCKIYVNTEHDRSWLLQQVAQQIQGAITGRTIDSAKLSVDVSKNEDYDPVRAQAVDGFVFFRYYMDIVPTDGVERGAYVGTVRSLILGLLRNGAGVIAACDFESELAL